MKFIMFNKEINQPIKVTVRVQIFKVSCKTDFTHKAFHARISAKSFYVYTTYNIELFLALRNMTFLVCDM